MSLCGCGTEREYDGKRWVCRPCNRRRVKAWAATEHGKARQRIHKKTFSQSAKGKAARKAFWARPDVKQRAEERRVKYRATVQGRYKAFEQLLRRAYGINVEDWARMYDTQSGKCAACRDSLTFDRNTHVEHNHATGTIRGLVCRWCNVALGFAKDDTSRLRALIRYLEERC